MWNRLTNKQHYNRPTTCHITQQSEVNNISKWHIVFDASSHVKGHPALNDALKVGPNLMPNIIATLLCFHLHKRALVRDGSQAFLQLTLHPDNRAVTRFFWFKVVTDEKRYLHTTKELAAYRFQCLPFGLAFSPFLLSAALRELAASSTISHPSAAHILDKGLYMDNFSAGDDDDPAVIQIYRDITDMMGQIQLSMAKWATNSKLLKKLWEDTKIAYAQKTRILGVDWDTTKDEFTIDYNDVVSDAVERPGTKCLLLAATSRFYDPLELFAPVSITRKIIFQDTWLRGLQWDEVLPADISTHWNHWVEDLQHLSFVSIPRWIKTTRFNLHLAKIHVFCDASERAYGAVIYIRTNLPSGISMCLLCSKARLAPIKRVTLPRLELLAALVGCCLLKYVTTETNLQREDAVLWSDAKVILGWIRGHPNRWKTFVQNRVKEIQSFTNPNQWRHCPGTDNPADHLSRGLTAEYLRSYTFWWRGPQWLSQTKEYWPTNDHPPPSDCTAEERKHVVTLHTAAHIELLDTSRFSSYIRLLRVTAWILRFITLCKIHPPE
ncbi:uncharacterized protein LOC111641448 [Centruroides sculpturatus]|uniref:uncharacterized protein LOC111641448 n=1 Tax=Centruroides sculpturatus TaxID=218467 RepID=UPI000C6CA02A|nr:uncharacterized protein LOC111641448 [Centruroides sculpturatus]